MLYSEVYTFDLFIDFLIATGLMAGITVAGRLMMVLVVKLFPNGAAALQQKISKLEARRAELEAAEPRDVQAIKEVVSEIAGYKFDIKEMQQQSPMKMLLPFVFTIIPVFVGNRVLSVILQARHPGKDNNILFSLPDGFVSGILGKFLSRGAPRDTRDDSGAVTTSGIAYVVRQLTSTIYNKIFPRTTPQKSNLTNLLSNMHQQMMQQQSLMQAA